MSVSCGLGPLWHVARGSCYPQALLGAVIEKCEVADIECRNKQRKTALMAACSVGNEDAAAALLNARAGLGLITYPSMRTSLANNILSALTHRFPSALRHFSFPQLFPSSDVHWNVFFLLLQAVSGARA
jgi:ankyrin repeat protein